VMPAAAMAAAASSKIIKNLDLSMYPPSFQKTPLV
jgi:hypothetical protein